ncbi:hypothetical protein [Limnovirga soli]|jgi:hypothetical protein|nr:hypothetical protein [Limnovirga soli]
MPNLKIGLWSAFFLALIIFAGGVAMGCIIISIYNDHVKKRDLKELDEKL